MNLNKFERYPLTFGVTPIEHLPRLSEAVGGEVEIYAKRDDCNSGLAMGGNKLRKLDGYLPNLQMRGVTDILTCGGIQSAHCAALSCLSAERGIRVHTLCRGERPKI